MWVYRALMKPLNSPFSQRARNEHVSKGILSEEASVDTSAEECWGQSRLSRAYSTLPSSGQTGLSKQIFIGSGSSLVAVLGKAPGLV